MLLFKSKRNAQPVLFCINLAEKATKFARMDQNHALYEIYKTILLIDPDS